MYIYIYTHTNRYILYYTKPDRALPGRRRRRWRQRLVARDSCTYVYT